MPVQEGYREHPQNGRPECLPRRAVRRIIGDPQRGQLSELFDDTAAVWGGAGDAAADGCLWAIVIGALAGTTNPKACQFTIEIGVKLSVGGNPLLKIDSNAVQFDEADALEKGKLCYARPLIGVRIGFLERLLFDGAAEQFDKPEYAETEPYNR